MNQSWDLITLLKQKIAAKGGGVCCHAHFDKAYVVNPEMLKATEAHMEVKWDLWKNIKANYTHDDLVIRISRAVESMISQGITLCRTNIDVDSTVGLKCVEAALEVKQKYAGKIELQLCSQVLKIFAESISWRTLLA